MAGPGGDGPGDDGLGDDGPGGDGPGDDLAYGLVYGQLREGENRRHGPAHRERHQQKHLARDQKR